MENDNLWELKLNLGMLKKPLTLSCPAQAGQEYSDEYHIAHSTSEKAEGLDGTYLVTARVLVSCVKDTSKYYKQNCQITF